MDLQPEHKKLIEILTLAGFVGICVGIAKHVLIIRHGSWSQFTVGLIASVLVAVFIGLLLDNTDFTLTTKTAMVGISAYIAEDLLAVIKNLSIAFKNDPRGFVRESLEMWRGKKP